MTSTPATSVCRTVASNIGFTEGPVWTSKGSLVVVSVSRGLLYRIDADTEPVVLADVGGGPNGMAEGPDGTLWVAQNGGQIIASRSQRPCQPGLQSVSAGEVRDVAIEGFEAPNDCAFGSDGRLWFTDPRAPKQRHSAGRVWRYDVSTNDREVVASGIGFPNGLAFDPSGKVLLVADSATNQILEFDVKPDGLGPSAKFADIDLGAPDGLAVDRDGRVYVAVPEADALVILSPSGISERTISFGERTMPTNLCFGGTTMESLFVTAPKGGRVLAMDETFPGRSPASWAAEA